MKKYIYTITGEYKDWLEMKKENTIVHNGSLIGLISYTQNRLELRLNYGTDKYYICEMKKIGNMIITVPLEVDDLNKEYIYIPLLLTNEEYEELIEISYIDKKLLENIQKATKNDIQNILLNNFKREFRVATKNLSFKELINNIIAFSEYDEEITNSLKKATNDGEVSISKLQEDRLVNIITYIDIWEKIYEWNSIVRSKNNFYFRIVDDYFMQI